MKHGGGGTSIRDGRRVEAYAMAAGTRKGRLVVLTGLILVTLGGRIWAIELTDAELSNRRCFNCHGQQHIADLDAAERAGMVTGSQEATEPSGPRSELLIDAAMLQQGVHATLACVACHADAQELPHAATLKPAYCNDACHVDAGAAFRRSGHAQALVAGEPMAPTCASCHGAHDILPARDPRSRTFPLKVINLCADCHTKHHERGPEGQGAATYMSSYMESVHGRAVTQAGLIVAATCVDCHGYHEVLPQADPKSSVHRDHIPGTCGKCHVGINETYSASIHGQKLAEGDARAPVCSDCHTAHAISQAATPYFVRDIVAECGKCHDQPQSDGGRSLYDTYRMSYHGQVTRLGSNRAARCSDCHGAHDILPVDDPASRLHPDHRAATCRSCHPAANANFAQFMPHGDYTDGKRYPLLHGIWLYFVIVMSVTFGFFGVHSLLWISRSILHRIKHGPHPRPNGGAAIKRFTRVDRVNHAVMIVSFFGLTLTGMPLFFSDHTWARMLAGLFGGVGAAGYFHRFFALLLLGNVIVHAGGLIRRIRRTSARAVLLGPNSMLPRGRDFKDFGGMVRWFFGGPKPTFDRWTYWEKFDYWAEIFGTGVIGFTGLMLWFPELFSRFMPGWMFNVATVVHGYEALLAVGFIFTIHFFNAHLRLEKFPVDDVMFTGRLSEAEFQHERGAEYERMKATGALESLRVAPAPKWQRSVAVAVGVLAMLIGTARVALIVLAGLKVI